MRWHLIRPVSQREGLLYYNPILVLNILFLFLHVQYTCTCTCTCIIFYIFHSVPLGPQYYSPEKCLFTSISSIPNDLLFSISKCYESRLTVCRTCFFDSLSGRGYNSGLILTLKADSGKTVQTCERGHMWRGLRVIPSSRLCSSYEEFIAIPPVPKHMQTSKSPFKVM